ncbi:MAG: IS1 family transposase [Gaiellaceae bacterium]
MNRLSPEKRQQVVAALVEGNSIRATCRMTGVAKNTVTKLLVDLGTACSIHMDMSMRDLTCERVQVDEIWAFCYSKQKNVPAGKEGEAGDVWTWVALDADTKLVPTYRVGGRDLGEAEAFIGDLASRLSHRIQLTSDAHPPYLRAVRRAFKGDVDYATLVKLYGSDGSGGAAHSRYSPGKCIGTAPRNVTGKPDPKHISTSYVERQNLTMRMSMRRFTRLTNAFSKKLENLTAAVSLHFCHYNYCRPHSALGSNVTPAMAAGLSDHVWTLSELIALLEAAEATPVRRGPYKKRQVA